MTIVEAHRIIREVSIGLAARDRLISCNMGLVRSVAAHYAAPDIAFDELEQEGRIRLLTIIDRYDPNQQVRFATYARSMLRGYLQHYAQQERSRMQLSLDAASSTTGLTLGESLAAPESDPYHTLELSQEYPDLRSVIMLLPEPDRQIVLAYYGFSFDEPASLRHVQRLLKLDISHQTIRNKLQRSLQTLREILGVSLGELGVDQ